MRTSEQIDQIAAALSEFQGELKPAPKESNNPAFSSLYADLPAVWETVRAPLAKHGLCIIQLPVHSEDDRLHLTTRLAHRSGQWVEETASIPVAKANAHGYGSGITYLRRFGMSAVLGVVADVDDDGNKAADNPKLAGKMPTKEFVDHCTAMGAATTADELREAFTRAVRSADKYGDETAKKSLTEKKDQLKSAFAPALAEQG